MLSTLFYNSIYNTIVTGNKTIYIKYYYKNAITKINIRESFNYKYK